MGRMSLLVGGLVSVLGLCGCPSGPGGELPNPKVGSLQLNYDEGHPTEVGKELQLRLSYGGNPPQQMMGAMMAGDKSTATWFADPKDAVEFDPTGKVTFKAKGPVKIWATYPKNGEILTSNTLTLEVTEVTAEDEKAKQK